MQFIHSREYLNEGAVVIVDCSYQCNVMLTDDNNFQHYRRGGQFEYYGGFFQRLPARIAVPRTGYWNITLDVGGGRANLKYSINVMGN
jgi:hypothetical protein